jgi:hypothetical protein
MQKKDEENFNKKKALNTNEKSEKKLSSTQNESGYLNKTITQTTLFRHDLVGF